MHAASSLHLSQLRSIVSMHEKLLGQTGDLHRHLSSLATSLEQDTVNGADFDFPIDADPASMPCFGNSSKAQGPSKVFCDAPLHGAPWASGTVSFREPEDSARTNQSAFAKARGSSVGTLSSCTASKAQPVRALSTRNLFPESPTLAYLSGPKLNFLSKLESQEFTLIGYVRRSFGGNNQVEAFVHWISGMSEPQRTGLFNALINTRLFKTICTAVIVVNVVAASLSADFEMQTRGAEKLAWLETAEVSFMAFYTVELLMRLAVHRQYFFVNSDAGWNNFDLTLVIVGLYDVIMTWLQLEGGANLMFVRLGRLLKLSKLLRIFKAARVMSSLRLMLTSVRESFAILFWALVFLTLMWWTVALVLLQGLTVVLASDVVDDATKDGIVKHFGTLPKAILTLFSLSTGGLNWEPVFDLVTIAGDFYALVLLLYLAFYNISLFNILTGIVVDHVVNNAQVDDDDRAMRFRFKKLQQAAELKKLFVKIDTDESGGISETEFMEAMRDQEIIALMEECEVDATDAGMFYYMLQSATDDSEVDVDCFVDGCMQMRGAAAAMDLQILKFVAGSLMSKVESLNKNVEEVMFSLENLQGGEFSPSCIPEEGTVVQSIQHLENSLASHVAKLDEVLQGRGVVTSTNSSLKL